MEPVIQFKRGFTSMISISFLDFYKKLFLNGDLIQFGFNLDSRIILSFLGFYKNSSFKKLGSIFEFNTNNKHKFPGLLRKASFKKWVEYQWNGSTVSKEV